MTNLKISQLSQAVLPLAGNELMTVVQGGQNVQCSVGVLTSISVTPSYTPIGSFSGAKADNLTGGGQAVPYEVLTDVSFTTLVWDTDGYLDLAKPTTFIISQTGFYEVKLYCNLLVPSSTGEFLIQIGDQDDGSASSGYWDFTSGDYIYLQCVDTCYLEQTLTPPPNAIRFEMWQSNSAVATCTAQAFASIQYLGGPPPPPPTMTQPFITSDTGGSNLSGVSGYTVGYKFTVGSSNLTVTQLGRYTYAGDALMHTVGIYNSSSTLIGSVTINASLGTTATYQYVTLGSPITLTAGSVYFLGDTFLSTGDTYVNVATAASTSDAAIDNEAYTLTSPPSSGNTFTLFGGADTVAGPPNFIYSV